MTRRRSRVEGLVARICDDAIDAIGPRAQRQRIITEVERRLRAAALPPPSPASLSARMAYRLGVAEGEPGAGARLVVDLTRLHLPVIVDDEATDPMLCIAMIDPSRQIVGHLLGCGRQTPSSLAAELIGSLATVRHAPAIVTRLPATASGNWPALRALLDERGVHLAAPTRASQRLGREIHELIGRSLGGLPIGFPRRVSSIQASASCSLKDVEGRVGEAIDAHNGRIAEPTPAFRLTRLSMTELRKGLIAFAN